MKRLLILPVAALLLTGCGTQLEQQASAEPDVESYLTVIRMDGGYLGQVATDSELLKLGAAACSELGNGVTVSGLADSIRRTTDTEDTQKFIASQIAASAAFLCPENV